MSLKRALGEFVRIVIEEAARNPEFSKRLEAVLKIGKVEGRSSAGRRLGTTSRASHRRAPAVLDPVDLARQGESVLRERLAGLTLEQLKDVVAEYGMDPGKLVLKWKASERIVDRIVEVSIGRAKKGEGFLSSGSGASS